METSEQKQNKNRPIMLKVVLASSLGTAIEWYDFFIYATLAVFLAGIFFPKAGGFFSIFLSLATFATGYLLRPLGGLFFGAMGDRIGRKKTFVITMLLMGMGTIAVGLLPTYQQVGIFAPLILVVLRMVQGIAVGGEYGGATIYVAENAPQHEMGYWTGWIQTAASFGLLCATGVTITVRDMLTPAQFHAWGWRIPFLLSVILVVVSLIVRLGAQESPVFQKIKQEGKIVKSPIKKAFSDTKNLKIMLFTLFGFSAGVAAMAGVLFLYYSMFLEAILKANQIFVSNGLILGIMVGIPFFPFFGWLSDKFGRQKVIFIGLVFSAVLLFPLFYGFELAVEQHNMTLLISLNIILSLLFSAVYGPYAAFMAEQFPPELRYTSLSLPFNIAFSAIGGVLPLICLSLVHITGSTNSGLLYPIFIILMSCIVSLFFGRKASSQLSSVRT